jgi:hypothetical protein
MRNLSITVETLLIEGDPTIGLETPHKYKFKVYMESRKAHGVLTSKGTYTSKTSAINAGWRYVDKHFKNHNQEKV